MKRLLTIGALLLGGPTLAAPPGHLDDQVSQPGSTAEASSPTFTPNLGQWDDRVLFRSETSGATIWVTADGLSHQFVRFRDRSESRPPDADNPVTPDQLETLVVTATLIGANSNPATSGVNPTAYKTNYFFGDDPTGWRTDVPDYRAIVLAQVYPGIDLTYYGNGSRLEYDFRVAAGADYTRIRIAYRGIEKLAVTDEGALAVTTAWGEIRELAPLVYQEVAGARQPVSAAFEVFGQHSVGFRLGPEFDSTRSVVIDPLVVYSTYLGGDHDDGSRGVAIDNAGAAYLTGETFSANFPVLNPYQGSFNGSISMFVTKLSAAGSARVYSTYIGGSAADGSHAIAVDNNGAAYVTGFASSSDFPTLNAYQDELNEGPFDAFVVKLSPAGNSLEYSTFLGGNNWDAGDAIAVDAAGAAYLTGLTNSTDFPTVNPYQASHAGGYDAFVTKLAPAGNALEYSTYLGGYLEDDGNDIAVDPSGAAYVTGRTRSIDFPTLNAVQPSQNGAHIDAFVTKISRAGNSLVYSTFLGGNMEDYGYSIAVGQYGTTFVTGRTRSANFPTLNPYQAVHGGEYDVFITGFIFSGDSLSHSTYLGGASDDYGYAIAVDPSGARYIAGRTESSDFPLLNPYQSSYQGGTSDAFVAKLATETNRLTYSTFLGGSKYDIAYGIAVDSAGSAYVAGFTDSDDFPTENPSQATLQSGGADAFVTKLVQPFGPDQDVDGWPDGADNCPLIFNPDQADGNSDGIGDVCCCSGRVGDANGSGSDEPTIGDVSVMIDALFISGDWSSVACWAEADLNGSGGESPQQSDITIGDVSYLIDYLFITGSSLGLPDCP